MKAIKVGKKLRQDLQLARRYTYVFRKTRWKICT